MKINCKSIVSLLAAATLLLSLCACGTSSGTNTNANGAAPAQQAANENIELSIWHIWPDSTNETNKIITGFAEQYQKENPHVKINLDATQQDEYQQRKLKVAAATGSQGDIFYTWAPGYSRQFIDAGAVLPLDDYFAEDKTYDRMLDGVMDYFMFDGKAYGIPCKNWAGVMFCNTELFEKYNVEYPETWDQLLTAVKTFRSEGLTPMAMGGKDAWHIGMYHNAIALRTAGVQYCNDALQGLASLDTPEIVESARLMKELSDAGAFMDGTLGVTYDEAQMEFFMGLVPMYYSGNWTSGDVDSDDNDVKGLIKVMPMPTVSGGKGDATTHLGGVAEGFMVNSNTKHPDEAVKLAIALTEYMSQKCYIIGDGLPAWKMDVDESEVSPTLIEIKKIINDASGFVLAWDTFLEGAAIDAHYNLLQALIGGTVTPEEFAQQMEEANKAQKSQE
ncbi:MAG: extracellular solute-binding protein [Oscillospiraceae bacterium]|nr:extracellular solute-binding protein [Oscillospiraceae bacterium]